MAAETKSIAKTASLWCESCQLSSPYRPCITAHSLSGVTFGREKDEFTRRITHSFLLFTCRDCGTVRRFGCVDSETGHALVQELTLPSSALAV